MSNLGMPTKVVGILTTILLLLVVNPWYELPAEQGIIGDATLRDLVTYAFWISFIVLLVMLFAQRRQPGGETVEIEGPAFTRFLFNNSRAGLFWLPIRLFLGFSWLEAGYHKFTGEGWMDGGASLAGYWTNAVAIPESGRPAITYDWYRGFLQLLLDNGAESWFAPLIVFGEMAVGLGLILGILTGFAAFFGAFMNMSFLLAGSASTNPVLFTLAVGVILAWKVAGYYGVDRWLLPILGTPWKPAVLAGKSTAAEGASTG
jgi:thiosulfate dehydrogenase [quinone] large subunit